MNLEVNSGSKHMSHQLTFFRFAEKRSIIINIILVNQTEIRYTLYVLPYFLLEFQFYQL